MKARTAPALRDRRKRNLTRKQVEAMKEFIRSLRGSDKGGRAYEILMEERRPSTSFRTSNEREL